MAGKKAVQNTARNKAGMAGKKDGNGTKRLNLFRHFFMETEFSISSRIFYIKMECFNCTRIFKMFLNFFQIF